MMKNTRHLNMFEIHHFKMMSFSIEIRKFCCSTHFRRVTRCVFFAANLTLAGIGSRVTVRSFSIDLVTALQNFLAIFLQISSIQIDLLFEIPGQECYKFPDNFFFTTTVSNLFSTQSNWTNLTFTRRKVVLIRNNNL